MEDDQWVLHYVNMFVGMQEAEVKAKPRVGTGARKWSVLFVCLKKGGGK